MEENYRNDVDEDYNKSIKNENILTLLFIVILVISVINIFYTHEILIYILIIINLIYVIISIYDDMINMMI